MQRWLLLFVAALMLAALPDPAAAQSRTADGWWDWLGRTERDTRTERTSPRTERDSDRRGTVRPRTTRDDRRAPRNDRRRDRDDDWDDDDRWDDDDWDDDDRYEDRGSRDGPPFCRNGRGHPVHGMQWCREKGFGDGRYDTRRDRRDDRWERRSIEDIIFGTPRDRDRRSRTVSGSILDQILGRRVYSDLASVAAGDLTGRWVYPDGNARVLQLRDTRGPLAELSDFDGDGRVDLVLVNRDR